MRKFKSESKEQIAEQGLSVLIRIAYGSRIFLFLLGLLFITGNKKLFSQGVGISEVTITPHASSILELRSTTRGFLAPRMTTDQRTSIPTPAIGLLVFDVTTNSFWYFDGFGVIVINGLNYWSITGNTGSNPATDFIGTTDNQPFSFRTNNVERLRVSGGTGESGVITLGNATTTSGTIQSQQELIFRMDGDVYGSSILRLRNRTAENGAIFENPHATTTLVDFIFRTAIDQRNIRYESRSDYAKAGAPSFHIGGAVPDVPTLSIGDNYAAFNRGVRIGTYPSATVPIPPPTALLHLNGGTSAAGTAPLKFTSGTDLSSPEAGAVEFDGNNYFVTTGSTRYTLAKTLTRTANLNFGNTPAGTSNDLSITVAGASDGDPVVLGVPNSTNYSNTYYSAWVSSANTVTVRFNNPSSTDNNLYQVHSV
ncbi:MAG: hypothetical protein U5K32_07415 [Bacteroidales bacterium]|nr:hypothetical protein [Bacteroidales bacterium]